MVEQSKSLGKRTQAKESGDVAGKERKVRTKADINDYVIYSSIIIDRSSMIVYD